MRRPFGLVLGLFLLLEAVGKAGAQPADEERRVEEKARETLEPTEVAILKEGGRLVFDYGFWVNYLFSDFKNDDNNGTVKDTTNATHALDPRFWIRAVLRPSPEGPSRNEHSLYLRVKDKLTWRDPGDSNGTFDDNGPHVDYLFLSLDFNPVGVLLGRRLYGVGQGLAYSNVHDGAELQLAFPTGSIAGLLSRILPHEDNLDESVPGGKKSGRTFYGVEGKWLGIPNHGLYGYVLFQRDDGEERPEDAAQDYDYDSNYFGVGSEGKLWGNLRYAAEGILETGRSFSPTLNLKKDVLAWAMDVALTYDVQLPTQPTLYAEYAFGSGDADRTDVTDTISGNAFGRDTNFLYFGYLPTGYALSPRLSNLRMFKVGMAVKPLERIRFFKEITVSVDLYWFKKDEPKGGIFDTNATQNSRDVGSEIDLTLTWPILSDLSLAVEYGHFKPGDAYPTSANDSARYFSVGATSAF